LDYGVFTYYSNYESQIRIKQYFGKTEGRIKKVASISLSKHSITLISQYVSENKGLYHQ